MSWKSLAGFGLGSITAGLLYKSGADSLSRAGNAGPDSYSLGLGVYNTAGMTDSRKFSVMGDTLNLSTKTKTETETEAPKTLSEKIQNSEQVSFFNDRKTTTTTNNHAVMATEISNYGYQNTFNPNNYVDNFKLGSKYADVLGKKAFNKRVKANKRSL